MLRDKVIVVTGAASGIKYDFDGRVAVITGAGRGIGYPDAHKPTIEDVETLCT